MISFWSSLYSPTEPSSAVAVVAGPPYTAAIAAARRCLVPESRRDPGAGGRGGAPVRSDMIKRGFERAPHRGLLRATGVIQSEDDFRKSFIAVCNSYVDIIPGHAHLQAFGRVVKDAIRAAGGIPFEFNTIGVDDGIVMGHEGMHFSLP